MAYSETLEPGQMFATVNLVRDVLTTDSGAEVRTPQVYGSVKASIEYLSGNELMRAQQVNATVNVQVKMYYRADVKAQDRIEPTAPATFAGKRYEIKSIIPKIFPMPGILTLECKSND